MESVLYERIKLLCKQRGIMLSTLSEAVGISESLIRKWAYTTSPSIDKVRKIAQYFDVSVDYLIGISEIPQSADKVIEDSTILSIQRARANMSCEDRELMMVLLRRAFEKAFQDE